MEKPKIKIVGITKKYEIEELEQNLKELNFPENNDKFLKVTYIKRRMLRQAVMRHAVMTLKTAVLTMHMCNLILNIFTELCQQEKHGVKST